MLYFSDGRGSHHSLPHPAEDIRGAGVDAEPEIFTIREHGPVTFFRGHNGRGISPGSVAIRSAEKRDTHVGGRV